MLNDHVTICDHVCNIHTYVDTLAEEDHNFTGPYNITFHAGSTHAAFAIYIRDNMTVEENKTLCLLIDTKAIPDPLCFGRQSITTVTVVDNDNSKHIMLGSYVCTYVRTCITIS